MFRREDSEIWQLMSHKAWRNKVELLFSLHRGCRVFLGIVHSMTFRNVYIVWPSFTCTDFFYCNALCDIVSISSFQIWDSLFCSSFSPQVILWSYSTAQPSVYRRSSPPPGVLCTPRIPKSSQTCIQTWGITTEAPASTWRRCSTNSGPSSWKGSSPRQTSQTS